METRTVLILIGLLGLLGVLVATDVSDAAVKTFERYRETGSLVAITLAGSAYAGSILRDPW
jgi:hypothetical protein